LARIKWTSPERIPPTPKEEKAMKSNDKRKNVKKQMLPRGWTEKKIQEVLEYYENQTEAEQVAEHEAAYGPFLRSSRRS
jgi:hypothetical protein